MGNEDILLEYGDSVMLSASAVKANFGISGRVGDYYYRFYIRRMGFYYIHCSQKYKVFKAKAAYPGG